MVEDNQKQKDVEFLRKYRLTMMRKSLITLILITKQIIDLYEFLPKEKVPPLSIEDELKCISIMEKAVKGDDENLELIYTTMEGGVNNLYRVRDHLQMEKDKQINSN